jgi:RNA polymerase-binding transcription factor DksA
VDEEGRLDGMLTETDLLHALVTMLWAERRSGRAPERADLATALANEQAHLAAHLEAYERQAQESTAVGRETPSDAADEGSRRDAFRLTEELAEIASRRLRAIEHALERQERGELLVCEGCGGAIPEARLRALPGTTLCIRCAREAETPR